MSDAPGDVVVAELPDLPDEFVLWHRKRDGRWLVLLRAPASPDLRERAMRALAEWWQQRSYPERTETSE